MTNYFPSTKSLWYLHTHRFTQFYAACPIILLFYQHQIQKKVTREEKKKMGYKHLAMLILISMCVVVTNADKTADKTADKKAERFKICIKECTPLCMSLDGATKPACDPACFLGCKQLQGKGAVYSPAKDNWFWGSCKLYIWFCFVFCFYDLGMVICNNLWLDQKVSSKSEFLNKCDEHACTI